jgi:NADH-quinone oxidoreductase subunit J
LTLFLFVVMMINIDVVDKKRGFVKYLPFGIVAMVMLFALTVATEGPSTFGLSQMPLPAPEAVDYNNIAQLGSVLYLKYAYPFEIAGVILLAAMIAAITLAHRRPGRRKIQFPSRQIAVRPEDRLRMIKMPPVRRTNGSDNDAEQGS